jgi:hypothetical protein
VSRIRTIKPEICTSEQVNSVSEGAELLFIKLWLHCDDRGVHPDSVARLKMECFPGRDEVTRAAVADRLEELVAARLVVRFDAEGEKWLAVPGWQKHQRIDRPSYRYPEPPATLIRRALDEGSTSARRGLATESKGVESKGKDQEGSESYSRGRGAAANGAADPRGKGMTLTIGLELPEGWKAAAAEARDAANLPPADLDLQWATYLARNDGETMRNARSAWIEWALKARPKLEGKAKGAAGEEAEGELSEQPWAQRVALWKKTPGKWMATHWGPPPDDPRTHVPKKFRPAPAERKPSQKAIGTHH